ncbi:MAG: DUF86 domain-containing protein [Desulfobacteraceae bacterium]|nr:DUF86 domain-containing protein [Desulfobacteraceae bacterium]
MPNIIKDNFLSILQSIELVKRRFKKIHTPDDFVLSEEGVIILDSISMRLQTIGELLKKNDKLDSKLFQQHPNIEWQQIMRLRDIISHHYESVDNEIIFDICSNHIRNLEKAITEIITSSE